MSAVMEAALLLSRKRKLREAATSPSRSSRAEVSPSGSSRAASGSTHSEESPCGSIRSEVFAIPRLVFDPDNLLSVVVTPQKCFRCGLWSDPLKDALSAVRASRGQQVRPIECGSLYTGMAGERKVLACLGIHARFPFGVEQKSHAVQFLKSNEQDVQSITYTKTCASSSARTEWAVVTATTESAMCEM